jgi:hypothetical protein
MSSSAAIRSSEAALGTAAFGGTPVLPERIPEQSTRMSHSAHEPAVRRKFLLVLKVLIPALPRLLIPVISISTRKVAELLCRQYRRGWSQHLTENSDLGVSLFY